MKASQLRIISFLGSREWELLDKEDKTIISSLLVANIIERHPLEKYHYKITRRGIKVYDSLLSIVELVA